MYIIRGGCAFNAIPFNMFVNSVAGVEKNNDVARCNYFSSNMHDIAGEVLKAEGRFEVTQPFKREKRKYTKKSEDYCSNRGIQENRKRRRLQLSDITNNTGTAQNNGT